MHLNQELIVQMFLLKMYLNNERRIKVFEITFSD
jgi:hypothetical protein